MRTPEVSWPHHDLYGEPRKGTQSPHTGELLKAAIYFKFPAFHPIVFFLFVFFFISLSTTQQTLLLTTFPREPNHQPPTRNPKGPGTSSCFSDQLPIAKPYNRIVQRDPAIERRFREPAPTQSLAESLVRAKPDS